MKRPHGCDCSDSAERTRCNVNEGGPVKGGAKLDHRGGGKLDHPAVEWLKAAVRRGTGRVSLLLPSSRTAPEPVPECPGKPACPLRFPGHCGRPRAHQPCDQHTLSIRPGAPHRSRESYPRPRQPCRRKAAPASPAGGDAGVEGPDLDVDAEVSERLPPSVEFDGFRLSRRQIDVGRGPEFDTVQ